MPSQGCPFKVEPYVHESLCAYASMCCEGKSCVHHEDEFPPYRVGTYWDEEERELEHDQRLEARYWEEDD